MPLPNPVIVIPGITATHLMDHYPVSPETVWGVMPHNKRYERVSLHPDNTRYEAGQPARVLPDQLFEVVYKQLIEELRDNLSPDDDHPVPVYPFGYDWRQPLEVTGLELMDFIFEVIARTRLTRHYHHDGYGDRLRVNIVGHSMGGLIVAGALQCMRGKLPVDKVVTLATPYRGSFEAIIKIITGTANLGTSPPSSRERRSARMTPSLYYLLPSGISGLVLNREPLNNLYDPHVWQPSVLKTIESYVKSRGLPTDDPESRAFQIFKGFLQRSQEYHSIMNGFDLKDVGLDPKDWLCVIGTNSITRVGMSIENTEQGIDFHLSSSDRVDEWDVNPDSLLTGDGTVPLESAVPLFLDRSNVVCVTPGDFGYWELQDRAIMARAGFHGILPTMNMLHRLIVRHFTGSADRRGNTWGYRAPGVEEWKPPMELREKRR